MTTSTPSTPADQQPERHWLDIPKQIDRDDLNTALQPLMELLGIDVFDWYAQPGLTINRAGVSFVLAAGHPAGEDSSTRRPDLRTSSVQTSIRVANREDHTVVLGIPVHVDVIDLVKERA